MDSNELLKESISNTDACSLTIVNSKTPVRPLRSAKPLRRAMCGPLAGCRLPREREIPQIIHVLLPHRRKFDTPVTDECFELDRLDTLPGV